MAASSMEARRQPARPGRRRSRRPAVPAGAADAGKTLDAVRRSARRCKACPLWANATQTVFGEGPARATIMLVGEQPGDREDLAGRPFVGPAGRMLDRALAEAGIDRTRLYVTNAVKHFKNEPRGKRRIHKKPSDAEIGACHRWLEEELELVGPRLIVALGATAARALFGRVTPIERNRGRVLERRGSAPVLVTVHPSSLLRVPDEYRAAAYRRFVDDLRKAAPGSASGRRPG
jgi:uracil-DNA glycosylase family protein